MAALLRQGELDFRVGYKVQSVWGFQEALVFTIEGIGASAFGAFLMMGLAGGMLLSVGALVLGAVLLFFHLGHPEKAWKSVRMMKTSWISRGTIFIAGLAAGGTVYVAVLHLNILRIGSPVEILAKAVLIVMCFLSLIYAGFVLARSPSIPFWNSGLLPVVYVLNGLTSGLSSVLLYLVVRDSILSAPLVGLFLRLQALLMTLLLICFLSYLAIAYNSGAAARESANMVLKGELRSQFVLFGLVAGIVVPIILAIAAQVTGYQNFSLLYSLAVTRVIGDFFMRYVILRAGVYERIF